MHLVGLLISWKILECGDMSPLFKAPTRRRTPKFSAREDRRRAGQAARPTSQERLASGVGFRHNGKVVDLLNEHYLWASVIWGAIAGGYLIYGWRQKVMGPFIGGLAMIAASFFIVSALLMSLACIALMVIVYWLAKQGY